MGARVGLDGGTVAADAPLRCPSCGGHVFQVRLAGTAMVLGKVRVDGPLPLGQRKVLSCVRARCGWRGTVGTARRVAA